MKSSAVLLLTLVLAACASYELTASTDDCGGASASTLECERTVPVGSIIAAKRCTNEAARTQERQDKDDYLNQRRGVHIPAPGNAR